MKHRLPAAEVRDEYVVDAVPGSAAWSALLRVVRPDAAAITLDIPQSGDWPDSAAQAAATVRRRAGQRHPGEPRYARVRPLAVDDEVWAAFEVLAGRSYDATVLRSAKGWDPVLELSDEGTSAVVRLGPEGWAALVAGVGAERVRPLPRRRSVLHRRGSRPPG